MLVKRKKQFFVGTLISVFVIIKLMKMPIGLKISLHLSSCGVVLFALRLIFKYYGSLQPSSQTVVTKLMRVIMILVGIKNVWLTGILIVKEFPLLVISALLAYPTATKVLMSSFLTTWMTSIAVTMVILIKTYLLIRPNRFLALDHEVKFKQVFSLSLGISFCEYLLSIIHFTLGKESDEESKISTEFLTIETPRFGIFNLILVACAQIGFVLVKRKSKRKSGEDNYLPPRITEHNLKILQLANAQIRSSQVLPHADELPITNIVTPVLHLDEVTETSTGEIVATTCKGPVAENHSRKEDTVDGEDWETNQKSPVLKACSWVAGDIQDNSRDYESKAKEGVFIISVQQEAKETEPSENYRGKENFASIPVTIENLEDDLDNKETNPREEVNEPMIPRDDFDVSYSVLLISFVCVLGIIVLYSGLNSSFKEIIVAVIDALIASMPVSWILFSEDIFEYAARKVKNTIVVYF